MRTAPVTQLYVDPQLQFVHIKAAIVVAVVRGASQAFEEIVAERRASPSFAHGRLLIDVARTEHDQLRNRLHTRLERRECASKIVVQNSQPPIAGDLRGVENDEFWRVGRKGCEIVEQRVEANPFTYGAGRIVREQKRATLIGRAMSRDIEDKRFLARLAEQLIPFHFALQHARRVGDVQQVLAPSRMLFAGLGEVDEASPAVNVVRHGEIFFVAGAEQHEFSQLRRAIPSDRPHEQAG